MLNTLILLVIANGIVQNYSRIPVDGWNGNFLNRRLVSREGKQLLIISLDLLQVSGERFQRPQQQSKSGLYRLVRSHSTGMDCKGKVVYSSTTETSGNCSGQEQLFPGFSNVCSESGLLQPAQRRVLPMINGEKQHEERKTAGG